MCCICMLLYCSDARVSLEEFVPIVNDMEQERQRVKQPTINDYIEALNQLDREGEGTIPSSLLRHALSTTGKSILALLLITVYFQFKETIQAYF